MGKVLKFKVFDKDGNDITALYDWFIDENGFLYYMTNDIDTPLMDTVGCDYTYAVELLDA